ncbi:signal recognition particle-docking protein FtsY [Bremerella cremea]|uniref:Signal recognition particle receptor FtsY n=1 Tax=Blastopirellula marina TaxID=124 RepID=A0A2S8FRV8_9BACT|nr:MULTISPECIES: signal recognition particle-docking protein FtsY [Pirellulaceae]PQO34911.1 signal recognition particle-docking protein FtsY [Blastopirellula marina]RCS47412.1 signal recognition particle-docking protein FtsY [Bremerella cremea]
MGIFGFGKKKEEADNTSQEETSAKEPGFFGRLGMGLEKTRRLLNTDIRDLFKAEGRLVDEELLDEIFAVLIRTDMGAGPANQIKDRIQRDFRGRVVHTEDILKNIQDELSNLMQQDQEPIKMAAEGPTVILVVGVNGAGKTTSIAKLTRWFIDQGNSVVLGAGDTFRAAATEQLTIWAERLGATIVKGEAGSDPASVAFRAVDEGLKSNADVVIIDTAGRLQTQKNLMTELDKMRRVLGKKIEEAPHEVLLVLDATAGQNGISQAKGFSEAAQCTGIVLTKLDGTAKGGVVVPIRKEFQLPVKFIGVGEKPEDLTRFDPQAFCDAMFAEG